MKADQVTFQTIDEYIESCPKDKQKLLRQLKAAIKKAAPQAEETISYQMPAFKYFGALVYFAACKNHIGFYPTSSGILAFQKELTAYKSSKGAVQFPLDEPLPLDLITRIVQHRVQVNQKKAAAKTKK